MTTTGRLFALQAVTTRASSTRVTATTFAGRCSVAWNHKLSTEENHARAVRKLAAKFDWTDRAWHLGALPGGGFVAVQIPRDGESLITMEEA